MDDKLTIETIKDHLQQKHKLKFLFEKDYYLAFDFEGQRIEFDKRTYFISKLSHRVKLSKISTLKDIDDFMEIIKNEKENNERNSKLL